MKKIAIALFLAVTSLVPSLAHQTGQTTAAIHPDFEKIRTETHNPDSRFYYPKLLESFMSNDTTMTTEDYHYFYYGTMFQEDYNPYRPNPFQDELKATEPLYFKHGTLSRSEKKQIYDLAEKSLRHNPLNLTQLMYKVYYYEQMGKNNHALIWKHKLDHLLLTIANSGTGFDKEHAWVIVYPTHEFDYFNISGVAVLEQEFEEPYYEKVTVKAHNSDKPKEYYFDLHHLLEQYYLKHPSDIN